MIGTRYRTLTLDMFFRQLCSSISSASICRTTENGTEAMSGYITNGYTKTRADGTGIPVDEYSHEQVHRFIGKTGTELED